MRFAFLIALSSAALLVGSFANAADESVALRIRFGSKDAEGTDWSGSLTPASGKVVSIRGWRWMPGDHAEGNGWVVATRRPAAQNREERQRVQRGEKLPMNDNGVIVTLSG